MARANPYETCALTPGKIKDGGTGDVACDQYHHYKEDIAILKRLNMKSYHFSTSWPRVQPAGTGPVNPKGLDYYSRLVDALPAGSFTVLERSPYS